MSARVTQAALVTEPSREAVACWLDDLHAQTGDARAEAGARMLRAGALGGRPPCDDRELIAEAKELKLERWGRSWTDAFRKIVRRHFPYADNEASIIHRLMGKSRTLRAALEAARSQVRNLDGLVFVRDEAGQPPFDTGDRHAPSDSRHPQSQ